jgi:hypothetical protein
MQNIQTVDVYIAGLRVRTMQLESLGWVACLYPIGRGRIGEYVFGETQAEVISKMTAELRS